MELMKEIITALQLFVLLHLLYWSFTWNLPTNRDIFEERNETSQKSEQAAEVVDLYPKGFAKVWNKHSIVMDSFQSVKSASIKALKISSSPQVLLPPFYTWKEEELNKQDADELKMEIHKEPSSHRKLNYASSKCGAKILASNVEAKYRTAILNEKVDDYMLNPCRAIAWFVIELCDTIEATQIELANYELYSSSPKTFSTFWSNVYPTQKWHPLGTFDARDQRSTQTFDTTVQNLGKFIKVIILSHHGREHYCPLSVFRILGYSMIYEYDVSKIEGDKGNKKNEIELTESTENVVQKDKTKYASRLVNRYSNMFEISDNTRGKFHHQCSIDSDGCLNRPSCTFFERVLVKYQTFTYNHISEKTIHSSSSFELNKRKQLQNLHRKRDMTETKTSKNNHSIQRYITSKSLNQTRHTGNHSPLSFKWRPDIKIRSKLINSRNHPEKERRDADNFEKETSEQIKSSRTSSGIVAIPGLVLSAVNVEGSTESAALIQKESVMTKLTSRIKASEISLNLINRYLQQLSETYREQMEDMQIMFNGTMKAIALASEKAAAIDEQQQKSIEVLQRKMIVLNNRIEYFITGHKDLLKRVMELHGFFLILEFIIMSTIFSIFVNNFKKNFATKVKNIAI